MTFSPKTNASFVIQKIQFLCFILSYSFFYAITDSMRVYIYCKKQHAAEFNIVLFQRNCLVHKSFFPANCTIIGFNTATYFDCKMQPSSGRYNADNIYSVLYSLSDTNGKMFVHISVIPEIYSIINITLKL